MAVSKVILNGTTLIDVTNDTVTAAKLLANETATAANGQLVVGSIASKSSSDLTVSGATVTVPAGNYSSDASKSVASGSATTPATTITANPTISVSANGLITATNSTIQTVTPTVSAGYVSSGTAGTITVGGSSTSQLTAQAEQTITPTTTDQTIAAGKYLTGTQTVKGDANLVAANIAEGVSIFGVAGTHSGGGTGQVERHPGDIESTPNECDYYGFTSDIMPTVIWAYNNSDFLFIVNDTIFGTSKIFGGSIRGSYISNFNYDVTDKVDVLLWDRDGEGEYILNLYSGNNDVMVKYGYIYCVY